MSLDIPLTEVYLLILKSANLKFGQPGVDMACKINQLLAPWFKDVAVAEKDGMIFGIKFHKTFPTSGRIKIRFRCFSKGSFYTIMFYMKDGGLTYHTGDNKSFFNPREPRI
jgi:hypothetical protein